MSDAVLGGACEFEAIGDVQSNLHALAEWIE
jgi:hypothetical protein